MVMEGKLHEVYADPIDGTLREVTGIDTLWVITTDKHGRRLRVARERLGMDFKLAYSPWTGFDRVPSWGRP